VSGCSKTRPRPNAGGTRVRAEAHAAADRVPFAPEGHRLSDGAQVAPAFGQPPVALERGAAAEPIGQILARIRNFVLATSDLERLGCRSCPRL
jgi:hypothetical protein